MQDQYSEYERDPDFYVDLLVLYEKGQLRIQENHPAEFYRYSAPLYDSWRRKQVDVLHRQLRNMVKRLLLSPHSKICFVDRNWTSRRDHLYL